jgi:hypothetical protein
MKFRMALTIKLSQFLVLFLCQQPPEQHQQPPTGCAAQCQTYSHRPGAASRQVRHPRRRRPLPRRRSRFSNRPAAGHGVRCVLGPGFGPRRRLVFPGTQEQGGRIDTAQRQEHPPVVQSGTRTPADSDAEADLTDIKRAQGQANPTVPRAEAVQCGISAVDLRRSARQSKRYSMSALYMSMSANDSDLVIAEHQPQGKAFVTPTKPGSFDKCTIWRPKFRWPGSS